MRLRWLTRAEHFMPLNNFMSLFLPLRYRGMKSFASEIKCSLRSCDFLYMVRPDTAVHGYRHTASEISSQSRVIRLCLLYASPLNRDIRKGRSYAHLHRVSDSIEWYQTYQCMISATLPAKCLLSPFSSAYAHFACSVPRHDMGLEYLQGVSYARPYRVDNPIWCYQKYQCMIPPNLLARYLATSLTSTRTHFVCLLIASPRKTNTYKEYHVLSTTAWKILHGSTRYNSAWFQIPCQRDTCVTPCPQRVNTLFACPLPHRRVEIPTRDIICLAS